MLDVPKSLGGIFAIITLNPYALHGLVIEARSVFAWKISILL